MHYVYVLYSKPDDKFYIGYTEDLKSRLRKHQTGGVHTTYRMKHPILAYYEACLSKQDAKARERQLKTGFGRAYIRRRLKYYLGV